MSATATEPELGDGDGGPGDGPTGGTHLARNVAIGVGIVLVLLVGLLATRSPSEDRFGANPLVGRAVPEIRGTTLDGSSVNIDSLRDKWVVVNFFATWCTPCKVEHPELRTFSEEHAAAGDAVVLSIAFEDEPERLRDFFATNGGSWPVVVGDNARLALEFGVTGVPESFVVSPAGQVVAHFNGVTAEGLDAVIAKYEQAAATAGTTP